MKPRKTKIICTIGPATQGVDNLIKLIETGMDAARLNFSHGSHEEHKRIIEDIRDASEITGKQIAILLDLQGPKIRTGKIEGGSALLEDGAEFIITVDNLEFGNSRKVCTSYKNLIKEVKVGKTILLDDGYIILSVEQIKGNDIITHVEKGGILKNNKGIITPGVSSLAPSLSEKDIEDLKFGMKNGADAIALSFVRSEKDIMELKIAMKLFGGPNLPVIAKIERYEGYEDIEDIIRESDGIMVARGDLGLEMPAEQVPVLQKEIIRRCNIHGKPVIVATQMLESMINNPRPTRAEASDVANAVIDGADCVMLSGETSIGSFPFDAVDYMNRIIRIVEDQYYSRNRKQFLVRHERYQFDELVAPTGDISDAFGKASCVIAEQIDASAIVSLTMSGYTANNIAKYRPRIPIIALSNSRDTVRFLNFVWGVTSILVAEVKESNDFFIELVETLRNISFIDSGDNIIFVSGLSSGEVLPKNMLKVIQV